MEKEFTKDTTYEKLQKLMRSYVPEFAYEPGGSDAGSALTDLCGEMFASCEERYGRVMEKHRIQYLNLFDSLVKEPVSAARGYVQFQPVEGCEGLVSIPKGTRVLAPGRENGEIVFETCHGITAVDLRPEQVVVTDGELGRIVKRSLSQEQQEGFPAFGINGENISSHRLYLWFTELFDGMKQLDLRIQATGSTEEETEGLLELFAGPEVCWSVLEPEGGERIFPAPEREGQSIHLKLDPYTPQRVTRGEEEGYCIVLTCLGKPEKLYIRTLTVAPAARERCPEEIRINGNQEFGRELLPFGKPLNLYQEMTLEDPELLGRRGAHMRLSFRLSYRVQEEKTELPELDLEYKAIMKKPKKPLTMRATEVLADEVAWEYLSRTGWKPLFREEHRRSMFNGSSEGAVALDFICPEDMADYEENQEGRIRLRLMRAENIYRMPALYKCPVISGLQLSYSYEEGQAKPSRILTGNNFDLQDLTECLQTGGSNLLFYETEGRQRTMYLGFDRPMSGLPLSLYFDIENYGDRPVRFRAEYLTEQGFQPVRMEDCTEGFGGSGNLLLMVPQDTVKRKLYGYEGYFLRFVCLDSDYAEYELPVIRGIYPNMAAVINVNTETEEFYLENREEAAQFQLSRQNLLNIRVEVLEQQNGMSGYVEWQRESHPYEGGRTYGVDMASGELTFRKYAFVNVPVPEEGPQIRVFHSNYSGREANLPAGSITVPGTAIRYLSAVTNPFPTCGGYDGYTEETAGRLVSGLLRTRGRAVTEEGYLDLISQEACGVRKIKCCNHTDARGRTAADKMTIAVLVEEYEKGAHVFSAVKKQIRDRLVRDSALTAAGKELLLIQPHFIRVNVRVWLERETMEQAYELQQQTLELIRRFLNPLEGGSAGQGWEIGELPEVSRLRAFLRAGLEGCSITKMVMTAVADGREVPMDALFYKKQTDPFVMAVSGEHMVYIEVSAC